MFGVGAGRVILRSVAEMLALKSHKPPDSCHTRQGMNAYRNSEDLLQNYKLYHGGVKVRVEQTHADPRTGKHKGSQSIDKLIQLGSRASNVDFVTFLAGFFDVQVHIQKFMLVGQTDGGDGPTVQRHLLRIVAEMGPFREHIQTIRIWTHITVHLIGYVSAADIHRLWSALLYLPAGRNFPTLAGALPDILLVRRFKGCGLQMNVRNASAVNPATHMLVAARCQCGTKRTPPGSCALVKWVPRQDLKRKRARNGGENPKCYRVAEWVARAEIQLPSPAQRQTDFRWQDTPPRIEVRAREERTPIWAQGISRYNQSGTDRPRCLLPLQLLDVFLDVDRSLVQLIAYIHSTKSYFDDYMGTKGCNDGARLLLESASIAWDWSYLLFNDTRREHVEAFLAIQNAFRDLLRHADRPARATFPYVSWQWPSDGELCAQYIMLLKRIRNRERRSHCFTRVAQVELERLRFPTIACTLVARNAKQRHLNDAIMWRVFAFLYGGGGPSMCGDVFLADPASLSLPGFSRRVAPKIKYRRRDLSASRPNLVRGSIVAVTMGPLRCSVAKVRKLHRAADAGLVHAALDMDKSLNKPVGDWHCWNAALLAHMCRLQLPSEAPCERWGSLLHNLYDPVQGIPPERSACRLFLKEAGLQFIGSERDESFVSAIAQILKGSSRLRKLSCFSARARECAKAGIALPLSSTLQQLRRQHVCDTLANVDDAVNLPFESRAYMKQTYRNRYRPAQLSDRELAVLTNSTRVTASNDVLLDAHTRWKEHGAASRQKSLAPSVLSEHLQVWLKSARGQEWAKTREKLFQNPDADECVDED